MQVPRSNKSADNEQEHQRVARRIRWRLRVEKSVPLLAQVITVLISLIALSIVGAQAWIYRKQLNVMTSQLTVMKEQLKAMNEAQAVMVEQTQTTKNSLRAYVGGSPTANIEGGQVTIILENVGRLPADKITVEVRESRRLGDLTPHGSITPFELGQQLIPGGKMPLVVQLRLQPDEAQKIASKTEILYISGTIKYDDGFGNLDTTRFGFEYIPKPNEGWTPRPELTKNN